MYFSVDNVTSTVKFFYVFYQLSSVDISWSPTLCLASDPGPQFVFTSPGPQFVLTGPGPQFVFAGPGPQFVVIGSGIKFVFTGSVRGLSLRIPTLAPQIVFTDPGLPFVLPAPGLNLHLAYW